MLLTGILGLENLLLDHCLKLGQFNCQSNVHLNFRHLLEFCEQQE